MAKKINEEKEKLILSLLNSGEKYTEIARIANCSDVSVRRIAYQNGIYKRQRKSNKPFERGRRKFDENDDKMSLDRACAVLETMNKYVDLYKTEHDALKIVISAFKNLPKKKMPYGSDIFNDYVNGWNDCIDSMMEGE